VANVVNSFVGIGSHPALVTVSPAQISITANQSLSVKVTVSSAYTGGGTPTGTVILSGGGYNSSNETLNSSGVYTFTIPGNTLSAGAGIVLTASYSGDETYASESNTATVSVTQLTPGMAVSVPSTANSNYPLTVTVTMSGTGGTPAGTVTLSAPGYTSAATQVNASGVATIIVPADTFTTTESVTLSAKYSGDPTYISDVGTASVAVTYVPVLTPQTTAPNEWTWMGGSNTMVSNGTFGILGTPAAGNIPPGLQGAVSWTDSKGNFWLFGGLGYSVVGEDFFNDLWEFNPSTKEWAWMSGSNTVNQAGVYGALGTPAAGNIPGSRYDAVSWTDKSGNLWLFGGDGYDNGTGVYGLLNDLWEYNPATNLWAWMGGSSTTNQPSVHGTLGKPAATNIPGNRYGASSWTDSFGHLWLFGGSGYDSAGFGGALNDLWEFNPSTNEWTWMGGSSTVNQPGIYGTLGTPAAGNVPGSRSGATSWTDKSGNLWLFGGRGLNDLWEFNASTNEWAWMGGSNTSNQAGVYGTLGTPAAGNVPGSRVDAISWIDDNGNLWLFGGSGSYVNGSDGYLNELWEFNPYTNQWAWMGGSNNTGQYGVYGTLGTPAAGNVPGSRNGAISWRDKNGNLWLFGGNGEAAFTGSNQYGNLNDLWEYQPPVATNLVATTIALSPAFTPNPSVYGESVTLTATVSSTAGAPPDGEYVSFLNELGIAQLSSGVASLTTTALPAGTDSITALYGGDANFAGSTSTAVNQVVLQASSTTALTSSLNPSQFDEFVTLTATVAGQYGGVATGTITFSNGNTTLGSAPLNSGLASLTITTPLLQGTNSIAAVYSGDSNFVGSTSNTLSQVVGADVAKQWAWMNGSSTEKNCAINYGNPNDCINGQPGVFGTLGTPAAGNTPGGRYGASSWTDSSGNFWLFGGYGFDSDVYWAYRNDLWKFDPSRNQWAWMNGASGPFYGSGEVLPGVYGTLGTPAAANYPGGRIYASTWTDKNGNLWLFGGTTNNDGWLNDLWEFNPVTNEWAWMSGSSTLPASCPANQDCGQPGVYGTLGKHAAGNVPGGRQNAVSWTDKNGNLWLFGGSGYDSAGVGGVLNDLWVFNPATNEWTWVSGSSIVGVSGCNNCGQSGVYGTQRTPDAGNTPGGRYAASNWTDKSGNLWLFGGGGIDVNGYEGELNDLWEFNPSTNEWAWMSGSSTMIAEEEAIGQPGVYGTLGTPAAGNVPGGRWLSSAWTDNNDNLWLFGGRGIDSAGNNGELNDFWAFNPSTNEWIWMGGSAAGSTCPAGGSYAGIECGQPGVYGTISISAAGNVPGSRDSSSSWTDSSGNLWLFGGSGYDSAGAYGELNDLWKYQLGTTTTPVQTSPTVTVTPASFSILTSQNLLVTVTVSGTPAPTGSVTLSGGGYTSTAVTLSSGSATINIPAGSLAVGNDTLTASYTPDANSSTTYNSATGVSSAVTVAVPNPAPAISSLSPAFTSAGGAAFTLTVNGTGFTANSTVNWGTTALTTTFVSTSKLTAAVTASQIASAGTSPVTVVTPAPGGGSSNALTFEIDSSDSTGTPPSFSVATVAVAAGSPASYTVTLPSSVTAATVSCLNLPTGASCSYSAGTVTITTSASTPKGTYQIIVVFTETVTSSSTAWILLPILLLPLYFARKRLTRRGAWLSACVVLVLLTATATIAGCGGGGSSTNNQQPPPPQTYQVVSSGTVTLTVQ
jgi:N-acetylneuraminic acid mutarotase